MIVLLSVSALWLLGMLAAAVYAQDAPRTLASGVRTAIAFAAVLPLSLWLTPQPNWIAVLLATGAVWRLIAGPMEKVSPVLAGSSAALVAALQMAGGVVSYLALSVTALGLVLAFWWSKGGVRARRWEWVLVGVALAIPPAGLASDILYGWHSATILNQAPADAGSINPPTWVIIVIGAALSAGLARGLWIRR